MTDPRKMIETLQADALDTLLEWFRRTGTTEAPDSLEARVNWLNEPHTFRVEDAYGHQLPGTADKYRVTVLVEPVDYFVPVNWGTVAAEYARGRAMFPVRLNGVEALVVSAVVQRWHVAQGTGTSWSNPPIPEENDVVRVVLMRDASEQRKYDMPPDGPVQMQLDPQGPAVAALLATFHGQEVRDGNA